MSEAAYVIFPRPFNFEFLGVDKRPGLGSVGGQWVWGCGAGLLSVGTVPGLSGNEAGES
jgi:hypothetical protein